MIRTLTIAAIIAISLFIYCNSGEGGNHPVKPPGASDTVKVDSNYVDTLRK